MAWGGFITMIHKRFLCIFFIDDEVYLTDEEKRQEYVLNDVGKVKINIVY